MPFFKKFENSIAIGGCCLLVFACFVFKEGLLAGKQQASAAIFDQQTSQANQETQPSSPKTELFKRTGVLRSQKIPESSGLASSFKSPGYFWTHNDSGHRAILFCISIEGEIGGELSLPEAKNRDWEAMASAVIDSIPHLIVGDVGDNGLNRQNCQLYILPEPGLESLENSKKGDIKARRVEFTYQDGPHNCEAMGVDPITRHIWLIEKIYFDGNQTQPPGVYALQFPESAAQGPHVAVRIGDFPIRNVTGMAFSPDGNRLIVRTYLHAHLYQRRGDKNWRETLATEKPIAVPLPLQRQGEAICFTVDSNFLVITSELKRQPVWQIDLNYYLEQIAQQKTETRNANSQSKKSAKSTAKDSGK
jgi:hypothetical protein